MSRALDPVLREEADHANADYAPHAKDLDVDMPMFRRYLTPKDLWDWRQMSAIALGDVRGKSLLDFGCGMGEESVYFAKLGAMVTGVDISEVGIASLKARAAHHRLPIAAHEMTVDPTEFPDASFDRVHGLGILHHVGFAKGIAEVRRLLRPGGVAVFLEPMGDDRAIETVKQWLMKNARFLGDFDEVTDHERNLTWAEIDAELESWAVATVYPYHLLFRLKRFLPAMSLDAVRRFDAAALTLMPSLKRYCGAVVLRVVMHG
jgi:SAM-dependent methyltransferase